MIYERDLDESIARYQGEVNPSIETCRKLAACLIVKRELFEQSEQLPVAGQSYSNAAESATENHAIDYDSGTEFSAVILGRDPADIWPIVDELMDTIRVIHPSLYKNTLRKLQG